MSTLLFKDPPITPQEKLDEAIKHGVKVEYGEDGGSVVGYCYKGVFYVCDVRVLNYNN